MQVRHEYIVTDKNEMFFVLSMNAIGKRKRNLMWRKDKPLPSYLEEDGVTYSKPLPN